MNYISMMAIAAITLMEAVAMSLDLNGDSLVYAVGAVAALGGAEAYAVVKEKSTAAFR